MKQWLMAVALVTTLVMPSQADDISGRGVSLTFATANQGREILVERDDFVQQLSPFDRTARMKTNKDISEDVYLRFVGENVHSWSNDERALIESAFSAIQPRINSLSLPWPETIYLIKTTGKEEGGAAYTRGNAIVLPANELLPGRRGTLKKTLSHELFHILTRKNPNLKEKLYAAIGFHKCGELTFPSKLKPMKITNPDAPKSEHCIFLQVGNMSTWAIPILFSRTAKYDVSQGGEFFDYLQFKFLLVEINNTSSPSTATYDDANIRLVGPDDVTGFFEQVGRNTDYIIHPEEILADNFALLVLGEGSVPSPEILHKMKEILAHARSAQLVVSADRLRTDKH